MCFTLRVLANVESEALENANIIGRRLSKLELGWKEQRIVAFDGFADDVTCLNVGEDL